MDITWHFLVFLSQVKHFPMWNPELNTLAFRIREPANVGATRCFLGFPSLFFPVPYSLTSVLLCSAFLSAWSTCLPLFCQPFPWQILACLQCSARLLFSVAPSPASSKISQSSKNWSFLFSHSLLFIPLVYLLSQCPTVNFIFLQIPYEQDQSLINVVS